MNRLNARRVKHGMITKLKIGNIYEIEGKLFMLKRSEFNHSTHGKSIVKYYFKKPTFEDGVAYKFTKFMEVKQEAMQTKAQHSSQA